MTTPGGGRTRFPCPFLWGKMELVPSVPPGDPQCPVGLMASLRAQLAVSFSLIPWVLLNKTQRKCFPGSPWRNVPLGLPRVKLQLTTGKGTRNDSFWVPGVPSSGRWVLSDLPYLVAPTEKDMGSIFATLVLPVVA